MKNLDLPKTSTTTKPTEAEDALHQANLQQDTYQRRVQGDNTRGVSTPKADKAGKYLCLVLRHKPSAANVTTDSQGWVDIDALIQGSRGLLSRSLIDQIVAENNKQRFAVSEDGKRIRARQGHSFPVELGLLPVEPPAVLYHGTHPQALAAIQRDGLKKMQRHHVHMAVETGTATSVGMRRGAPVILQVDAKAMHVAGHTFYCSENGVWLTDAVPQQYVKVLP